METEEGAGVTIKKGVLNEQRADCGAGTARQAHVTTTSVPLVSELSFMEGSHQLCG